MDVFRFNNPDALTKMSNGRIINGIDSLEWIDRYAAPGEFKITGLAESGLARKLPEGCYIGRFASDGVMMVEDHQITEEGDSDDSIVTITGRSVEAPWMEERIIGVDRDYAAELAGDGAVQRFPYPQAGGAATWNKVVALVRSHMIDTFVDYQTKNVIPHLEIHEIVSGLPETTDDREIGISNLLAEVSSLLAVDHCGLKVFRPGRYPSTAPDLDDPANTAILVHRGEDLRDSVIFSFAAGEIESADYLWSRRKHRNCILVFSKWFQVQVDSSQTGMKHRMMSLDASDLDDQFDTFPDSTARAFIVEAMKIRGKEKLAKNRMLALANVDLSRDAMVHIYGRDYNIGDIITVRGNYQEARPYRVVEHVYIEDDTGVTEYPNLVDLETEEADD